MGTVFIVGIICLYILRLVKSETRIFFFLHRPWCCHHSGEKMLSRHKHTLYIHSGCMYPYTMVYSLQTSSPEHARLQKLRRETESTATKSVRQNPCWTYRCVFTAHSTWGLMLEETICLNTIYACRERDRNDIWANWGVRAWAHACVRVWARACVRRCVFVPVWSNVML